MPEKTNYMLLGTRYGNAKYVESVPANRDIQVKLGDTNLQKVSSTNFLGVIIDENLTWKSHIDGILKTIARNVGVLNKLKCYIPKRVLNSLYCTLILAYVNYSTIVWGNTYHSYMDKIFKLQKWAVRTISNSHYRSHSAPLFQNLIILNVYDTYNLEVGVFMFRHFTQLPNGFRDSFSKQLNVINILPEMPMTIPITRNKKVFSDQTVRTSGPVFWNSLHQNLKMSKTVKHFRNQLKNYLISQY